MKNKLLNLFTFLCAFSVISVCSDVKAAANVFFDNYGKAFYYGIDGNPYYYPDNVPADKLGIVYYDNNGRAFYYGVDGKIYYYPDNLPGNNLQNAHNNTNNYQANPNTYQTAPQKQPIDTKNFLNAQWWKTATLEDVKKEIQNGANVNSYTANGYTPLIFAAENTNNPEIIKFLYDSGAQDIENILSFAARNNPNGNVIDAIKEKSSADFSYNNISNLLIEAATYNTAPDMIKALIRHGANVNYRNNDQYTPLMYAVLYNSNPEVIRTLMKEGANPKITDKNENTAIMLAKHKSRPQEIIEALENPYSDVPLLNYQWWATATLETLEQELSKGSDVNASRYVSLKNGNLCSNWTVLMIAVEKGVNINLIKKLLESGADINRSNCNNITALGIAADYNSNKEVVDLLRKTIEKEYNEADIGDKADFESIFSGCLLTEKMQEDYKSSLSAEMQLEMMFADAFSMGLSSPQRSNECKCIFNAARNYLGYDEYKSANNAIQKGRFGTFKKIFNKAMPAAYSSCY